MIRPGRTVPDEQTYNGFDAFYTIRGNDANRDEERLTTVKMKNEAVS